MRTYITHITRDYLDIAHNLAISLRNFSEISLVIYCVNLQDDDRYRFNHIKNVHLRNIEYNLEDTSTDDYLVNNSGNFYVNRNSLRIYKILCLKTIAMQMALEEGFKEVCYLDSDCIATPIVDDIFNWSSDITNYPLATEGIHQYVMFREDSIEYGNPFSGGSWPNPDNKLALEWPLMNFLDMKENQRGTYRTTNILLMNQNCLEFIKTWRDLCFLLPKLVNVRKWAGFHEETIYNVLNWRETNKGLPLCYVNLSDGIETVKHLYSDSAIEGELRWDETDTSRNFYKIPESKTNIKVLHGEKRTSEVNKIISFFTRKESKILIQIDTFIKNEISIEITTECINRVKKLGLPILLTSHLPIPDSLKKMVDYYQEDLNNILLPDDGAESKLTFVNQQINSVIFIRNSDSHAPACLTSVINGARFAKENGFDFFIRFEYDVVIKEESLNTLNNLIHSASSVNGLIFTNSNWLDGKIVMLNTSDYLEIFNRDIKTSDDYYSLIREYNISKNIIRHLQSVQYEILNSCGKLSNVMQLPVSICENFIDSKFLENKVKPGIFRPVSINGSSNQFANICQGWDNGSCNIKIFLNDILVNDYEQYFSKNTLSYNIFDFIDNSRYKIIAIYNSTSEEEIFEFSSIDELSTFGKILFS